MSERDRLKRWTVLGLIECVYCQRVLDPSKIPHNGNNGLTWDHKTPTVRGGSGRDSNLVPSCHWCNTDKGPLTYGEYMQVRHDRQARARAVEKLQRRMEQDVDWTEQRRRSLMGASHRSDMRRDELLTMTLCEGAGQLSIDKVTYDDAGLPWATCPVCERLVRISKTRHFVRGHQAIEQGEKT